MRAWWGKFVFKPAHYVGGAVLVALMSLVVADVVGRYAFNTPVPGAFELTELAMVAITFFGLGYAQQLNEHITIDLVYIRFSPRLQAITRVLTMLTSLALALAVSWQLFVLTDRIMESGQQTGVLAIPIYPAVALAGVCFAIFSVSLLLDLVDSVRALIHPSGR